MAAAKSDERLEPWTGKGWNTFSDSAQAIIGDWTVVQLAVDQAWGGPNTRQKYNDFVDTLLEMMVGRWDRKQQLNQDKLADWMDKKLEGMFNVIADDGSVDQVARIFAELFKHCSEGNVAPSLGVIERSEKRRAAEAKRPRGRAARLDSSDDSDASCSEDEDEAKAGSGSGAGAGAGAGAGSSSGTHADAAVAAATAAMAAARVDDAGAGAATATTTGAGAGAGASDAAGAATTAAPAPASAPTPAAPAPAAADDGWVPAGRRRRRNRNVNRN